MSTVVERVTEPRGDGLVLVLICDECTASFCPQLATELATAAHSCSICGQGLTLAIESAPGS